MSVIARTMALLRVHEGTKYRTYTDTKGLLTWGTGWCLERREVTNGERAIVKDITGVDAPWDDHPALGKWLDALQQHQKIIIDGFMLRSHVLTVAAEVETRIGFWPDLDDNRAAAILDMAYNMGVATLLTFKITLTLLSQHRWIEAAGAVLESQYALDVGKCRGQRAYRIAQMLAGGKWPTDIEEPKE